MNIEVLITYAFVSFFYVISPGPAVFLALHNGMTYDLKVLSISSFANICALFILSAVSISGLGVILATSSSLFMGVKIVGALYLLYLGVKQFRNAKKSKIIKEDKKDKKEHSSLHYFLEAFILAITNPKPIIFFIALFPQFLNLQSEILPQFFVMTGIFMFFSFISLFAYGYMAKKAKHLFNNERKMAWFHRVTGGIFIALGIALLQLKSV
ncbi:MAG: LysE family translocator [Campylobacteraceae bacterium]|nr:LysE family translocator [Campylobacteraceae bacterium]